MLGHRVGHSSRRRHEARHRRGIDDMPEALLHHNAVCCLDSVYHSAKINVYYLIPFLNTVVTHTAADRDSRVIEHVIQSTGTLDRVVHELLQSREISHIQFHGRGIASSESPDSRSDFFRYLDLTIRQYHLAATFRQF